MEFVKVSLPHKLSQDLPKVEYTDSFNVQWEWDSRQKEFHFGIRKGITQHVALY